jgi:peptidoglycan/xylan/chitin deacetylase (PgdA/CDA1 family)
MMWKQLEAMERQGITIESHSAAHSKLGRLPAAEVTKELSVSKAVLERKLNKKITAICYPAGSFSDEVATLAAQVGYSVGFTTRKGLIRYPLAGSDRLKLTRFDVYGDSRHAYARFIGKVILS